MPSVGDGRQKRRFEFARGGKWQDSIRHCVAGPQRRILWLAIALFIVVGVMTTLSGRSHRRARPAGDDLRVIELSPAPESALPLMPFSGARPDAEIEFKALLMRLPASRQTPPALLSVHTLSGKLGEPIIGHLGSRGEYELGFVPHYNASREQIVLSDFRFAPAGGGPEARRGGNGPQIVLELEKPTRIDPPMEPEEGGALVLQITGRLRKREVADP
jgi:hypothetical protein